jgi:RNA polymerase-binding protein DksA
MVPDSEFAGKEKQRLLEERAVIEDELESLRESMLEEVDVEPDEGDAGIFEREKTASLIAVLERKLSNIDAALRAIEKGQYGICERCGNPIETERLEVKPDATLCLNCQREVDALNKRNRRAGTSGRW